MELANSVVPRIRYTGKGTGNYDHNNWSETEKQNGSIGRVWQQAGGKRTTNFHYSSSHSVILPLFQFPPYNNTCSKTKVTRETQMKSKRSCKTTPWQERKWNISISTYVVN